jgi:hypothetical protein
MILPAADMVAISSDYEDTPMAFECMASRHRLGAAAGLTEFTIESSMHRLASLKETLTLSVEPRGGSTDR